MFWKYSDHVSHKASNCRQQCLEGLALYLRGRIAMQIRTENELQSNNVFTFGAPVRGRPYLQIVSRLTASVACRNVKIQECTLGICSILWEPKIVWSWSTRSCLNWPAENFANSRILAFVPTVLIYVSTFYLAMSQLTPPLRLQVKTVGTIRHSTSRIKTWSMRDGPWILQQVLCP